MIRRALFIAIAVLLPTLAMAEIRLLRHPSYSKGKVAFSYLGDIWVADENGSGVERLTDNKARDIYPRFSPDGQWIAFSSNRDGNYDVYVIQSQGGKPRQLTFVSADDNVVGWTPDSKKVLFQSTRAKGAFPSVATLFEVSIDGGLEQPVDTDWGYWGSYAPEGGKMAFSRHPSVWSRKHYRGSFAADLWVLDVAAKKFTKLGDSDYHGNYLWPMYGRNGEIYFVADRMANEKTLKWGGPEVMKSVNNIWKMTDRGGAPVQVTHHTSGNLFFPSISADGKTIVYEENFGLWKLDTTTGKSSQISIDIKSDPKENEVELRTVQNEADGFSLSPSTRRAAVSTHGEIFSIATDRGEVQRVSESPWREEEPVWSPNGKWIAFVSDRTGRQEVWIADEHGRNAKQLTDADCDKPAMVWAPDSKSLLWSGSDHKLRRVDLESAKTDVLASSDAGNIQNPQISPDGKWISYSKPDAHLRAHVYVKPLDSGAEHMLGADDFLMSNGAKWTPDGKRLLILGGVGAPAMSALNRTIMQLYSVALTHLEKNPNDRDVDSEEQAEEALDTPRRGAGNAGTAPKVEVKIEWDGLDRRMSQLTHSSESVITVAPSPDSRTYAFLTTGGEGGGPALYTIAEDGSRLTRISQPPAGDGEAGGRGGAANGGQTAPQWARDSRSIYFMQSRNIYSVAVPNATENPPAPAAGGGRGGRGGVVAATATNTATPRRIDFTVRLEIDQAAERRQVFEEAWRVMKNRYYDPSMHGVNWAAAKDTYEPLLANIADSEELHTVIMQMIGELNASHTGIQGGNPPQDRIQTRYPGFEIEPDASGYYKVAHIYRKGPADHDYVKLAVGNFILAVNGKELKTSDNYWKLYNLAFGRKFEFTVNSKPAMDGAWPVSLEPLNQQALGNLQYDRWVDEHKALVAKLSNGEIGYLHIRAMDAPSLARFERDLLDNQGKKALIIDERFNGGGGIDQELLEILNQRKQYESYRGRDSVMLPRPMRAFFGPMVVLQNERSASNAEMFPEGFKTLGLGKVIGVPTMGAVIGTGAYALLDGFQIRTPGTGVYTAAGVDFENYGVPPDVLIDNTPADFIAGHDRQIEKAVEVLRSEMK